MKKIAILGSTGKIGTQTLDIVREYPQLFQVIGLACKQSSKLIKQQINEFKPKITCITDEDGEAKLEAVATHPEVDLVIVAVVGIAGLLPTLKAIEAQKEIALATKEVLVIAGDLVMQAVRKYKVNLIPIDSEHSALYQSIGHSTTKEINKLILTMGKGPIAKRSVDTLSKVTMQDIMNRPNWSMGTKIAVDSATGVNKAFEVIEACHLFGVKADQVEITVHPEYMCHSLVEFNDGSMITELGTPDMHRYIHYALFFPKRQEADQKYHLNIINQQLSFEPAPYIKFPCLHLGHRVMKKGGTFPAIMHGADKAAVDAFIEQKINFTQIPTLINKTLDQASALPSPDLQELLDAERWGQQTTWHIIDEQKEVL